MIPVIIWVVQALAGPTDQKYGCILAGFPGIPSISAGNKTLDSELNGALAGVLLYKIHRGEIIQPMLAAACEYRPYK
jgi:hypothetical protein